MNVYKKWKRVALFVCVMMVVSCVYIKFPAKAATVYPNQYTYIKPAPQGGANYLNPPQRTEFRRFSSLLFL